MLSQHWVEDCRPALQAHFADLAAGAISEPMAKLVVLGNGSVGKTQLCRKLRGLGYDPSIASTHGITIADARAPSLQEGVDIRLKLWDFGGQDIYHGTHGLFLRTRAVFVICWTPETEKGVVEQAGMTFINQPLDYWLDSVMSLAGAEAAVLVVQTRADTNRDERALPAASAERLRRFAWHDVMAFSAREGRGLATLRDKIADATKWMADEFGVMAIGKTRLAVIDRLAELAADDEARDPDQRLHRLLTMNEFESMCAEAGRIASPPLFLQFLHRSGLVFHEDGIFNDAIVLDQQWALDAIYTVFDRDRCAGRIMRNGGRFDRFDLSGVWKDHSDDDQRVFLDMMVTSNVAFRLHRDRNEEAVYVAPDLLPSAAEARDAIEAQWDDAAESATQEFRYTVLHDGFVRSLIAGIGHKAGPNALYWKTGGIFFDGERHSRARIEAVRDEGRWSGVVRISAQRGDRDKMLEVLTEYVIEAEQRLGIGHEAGPDEAPRFGQRESKMEEIRPLPEPLTGPGQAISYAWGDDTPEGKARDAAVEGICAKYSARGVIILHDKDAMRFGDSIEAFMNRLADTDRVFIVLSDKYLRSPFCMYELHRIWNNCRRNEDEFIRRTRLFKLPDVKIGKPTERVVYAKHWRNELDELETAFLEGPELLSERDLRMLKHLRNFIGTAGDVLSLIADRNLPRDFQRFLDYGFDEER